MAFDDGAAQDNRYPSASEAFNLAGRSYAEAFGCLDAVHRRIDSICSLTVTLTLAAPALAKAVKTAPDFGSHWFVCAMIIGAAIVVVGLVAHSVSGITTLDPAELYGGWLHLSVFDFQVTATYWAGQHFHRNVQVINRKSWAANGLVLALLVEVGLLVRWLSS